MRFTIAAKAVVSSILVLLIAAVTISMGDWPIKIPPGSQAKPEETVVDPAPAVSVRFKRTELLDLQIRTIELGRIVEGFVAHSGAIEIFRDNIIVAERDGRFLLVTLDGVETPDTRWLKPRLELNSNQMRAHTSAKQKHPEPIIAVRVTDLLVLDGGEWMAIAHGLWNDVDKCATMNVTLIKLADLLSKNHKDDSAWNKLFQSQPCVHVQQAYTMGGRLEQRDAGKLILTIGSSGQSDPSSKALSDGDYGKIVEIDISNGLHRIVSIGHRNTQGLAVGSDGRIWSTEHGPAGGDELNLIVPGRNYGWPRVTFGTDYGSRSWPHSKTQGRHDGYQVPTFAWLPSIGVSNVIEIANFHERWNRDLVVASMRGESLHRLRLSGDRVVFEERVKLKERLRDMLQAADGTLVLWTDDSQLLTLQPIEPGASPESKIASLPDKIQFGLKRCAKCHGFDRESADRGKISLHGIHEKRLARGPADLYTPEMLKFSGRNISWSEGRLTRFLKNPEKMVPGTSMASHGEPDREVRLGIISFLMTLR